MWLAEKNNKLPTVTAVPGVVTSVPLPWRHTGNLPGSKRIYLLWRENNETARSSTVYKKRIVRTE